MNHKMITTTKPSFNHFIQRFPLLADNAFRCMGQRFSLYGTTIFGAYKLPSSNRSGFRRPYGVDKPCGLRPPHRIMTILFHIKGQVKDDNNLRPQPLGENRLAVGHFLGHVQKELAVYLASLAQETAELV